FNKKGSVLKNIIEKIGKTPLPPYIAQGKQRIAKQYQTVYAKHSGSAAAPTAGFHFTKNLLNKIKRLGCQTEFVTLHVGLGTFNPVNTERVEDYKIHSEWASVDGATMKRLITAKKEGKRIIAVGTTSTRVLETIFNGTLTRSLSRDKRDSMGVKSNEHAGLISTFIYPGYKFKFVDAMITNFHLPKSTLLMLVSAFIGRGNALKLYKLAIQRKYRFFSYGDAMLLT
ncbi:MAG: tRNA preQ1(34) S-adenosylmethionine ribosyltransferase-isomerase QueA, partial [Parcubacteria group bacterium]